MRNILTFYLYSSYPTLAALSFTLETPCHESRYLGDATEKQAFVPQVIYMFILEALKQRLGTATPERQLYLKVIDEPR